MPIRARASAGPCSSFIFRPGRGRTWSGKRNIRPSSRPTWRKRAKYKAGMAKPRVLCLLDLRLAPDALAPLRRVAEVDCLPASPSALRNIEAYDACLANADLQFDASVIHRAKRLR